ncbi:MAG: ParB N-terminal domain-containing protein [Aeropyrum sp.]|nr:ParB N-terminal domain-containing protein [Aeropyrum sp.]MCE4616438.1 ParB N-terminal domain-containing protein [Aeropyrum sp.]
MYNAEVEKILQLGRHGVLALVPIDKLKRHEEVLEHKVASLEDDIRSRGVLIRPILVDAKTLVILDGHHRVEALRRLGARRVPAVLVDYDSDCVNVDSWREGVTVSKDEVRRRGLSGDPYPPKTSRHRLCFNIPEVNYSLSNLV